MSGGLASLGTLGVILTTLSVVAAVLGALITSLNFVLDGRVYELIRAIVLMSDPKKPKIDERDVYQVARAIEDVLGRNEWIFHGFAASCPTVVTSKAPVEGHIDDPDIDGKPYAVNEVQFVVDAIDPTVGAFKITGRRVRYSVADVPRTARDRAYKEKRIEDFAKPIPKTLSANMFVVCPLSKSIIVQDRKSMANDDQNQNVADRYHFNGGAYLPKFLSFARHDFDSLGVTATREILEEVHVPILVREDWPAFICEEVYTGYIQCNYLCCAIGYETEKYFSPPDKEKSKFNAKLNEEGRVVRLSFDDFVSHLMTEADLYFPRREGRNWIESGYAAALLWLGLGAPVFGVASPVFRAKRAKDAYKRIMAKLNENKKEYGVYDLASDAARVTHG